jgi:hypothetical protein
MYEEAITEMEKRRGSQGGSTDNRATQIQNFAELKEAYRKAGAKGFWEQDLKHLKQRQARGENVQPHRMAEIYAYLGDKNQAFQWLEKVVEERGGDGYIKVAKKVNVWRVTVSLQTKFMSRNLFIKIRVPSNG